MMRAGSRYKSLHFLHWSFLGAPGEILQYFLNYTIVYGRLLDERVPYEMLSLDHNAIRCLFSFQNGVSCDLLP